MEREEGVRPDGSCPAVQDLDTTEMALSDTHSAADPGLATTLRAFADTRYRDLFWPTRRYEDMADRIALRAMLPRSGGRLLEVGAGFGRLADEYQAFGTVVLLDASQALLEAARERVAGDPRFSVVCGDAFSLPFPSASFEAVVCIRVIHHFADPRPAIAELGRVLRPGGVLVLESANRRNIRAIITHGFRHGLPSPFARGSIAYADAYDRPRRSRHTQAIAAGSGSARWYASSSYLHGPIDLRTWLEDQGMRVTACRSVGLFRPTVVTGHLPVPVLVALERVAQPVFGRATAGPSIMLRAVRRPTSSARCGVP